MRRYVLLVSITALLTIALSAPASAKKDPPTGALIGPTEVELRHGGDGCQLLVRYDASGSVKRQVEYTFDIDDPADHNAPNHVVIDLLKPKDVMSSGAAPLGYGYIFDPPALESRTVTITLDAELSSITGKKHDPTKTVLDTDHQAWGVNVPADSSECTFYPAA